MIDSPGTAPMVLYSACFPSFISLFILLTYSYSLHVYQIELTRASEHRSGASSGVVAECVDQDGAGRPGMSVTGLQDWGQTREAGSFVVGKSTGATGKMCYGR